jgi:hypothetical protein
MRKTSKLIGIRFPKICKEYLKQLPYSQVLKRRLFFYLVSWASTFLSTAVFRVPVALLPSLFMLSYENHYYYYAY